MTSHTISSLQSPGANTELRCPHNVTQRHSPAPSKERYMEWSHRADNSTPNGRLLAPDSRAGSEELDRHSPEADDRVCGRYCFSRVYWFCVRSVTPSRCKREENGSTTGRKDISRMKITTQIACHMPFLLFLRKSQCPFTLNTMLRLVIHFTGEV